MLGDSMATCEVSMLVHVSFEVLLLWSCRQISKIKYFINMFIEGYGRLPQFFIEFNHRFFWNWEVWRCSALGVELRLSFPIPVIFINFNRIRNHLKCCNHVYYWAAYRRSCFLMGYFFHFFSKLILWKCTLYWQKSVWKLVLLGYNEFRILQRLLSVCCACNSR